MELADDGVRGGLCGGEAHACVIDQRRFRDGGEGSCIDLDDERTLATGTQFAEGDILVGALAGIGGPGCVIAGEPELGGFRCDMELLEMGLLRELVLEGDTGVVCANDQLHLQMRRLLVLERENGLVVVVPDLRALVADGAPGLIRLRVGDG